MNLPLEKGAEDELRARLIEATGDLERLAAALVREKEIVDTMHHAMDEENEQLEECCTRRGARLQLLRSWITDWRLFVVNHPEAAAWFDQDGVPR